MKVTLKEPRERAWALDVTDATGRMAGTKVWPGKNMT